LHCGGRRRLDIMSDYTALNVDLSLLGPELTLLVASFVILCLIGLRRMSLWAPILSLVALGYAFYLAVNQWYADPVSGFAGMLTCDDYGVMFKWLFMATAVLTLLIAHPYLKARKLHRPEFYCMLMVSTVGMMVMANTTDLVTMFIGLEVMSVPLYVMAAFNTRDLLSNEAGIKYFLMGAFSTAFLLMGIALVFGAAETTNLRRIIADFSYIAGRNGAYLYPGIGLILVGFTFKVGAVPFHSWVPDVYQGAPTPVTAFFSVAPKAAGFAALMRIFLYGFAEAQMLTQIFWVMAVLTMTLGNVLALRQTNVKRMLAYSSIAHAGYVLVALTVGTQQAISAAIFYLVGYAFFNIGAFAVLTHLETRSGTRSDLSELRGISKASPYLAVVLALFMFALSGFPPTVGFFGKFYVFSAAVKEGFILLAVIGVMNSFVSVYYYLQVIKTSYFDKAETPMTVPSMAPSMLLALIITAAGTLGLGLIPEQLLEMSRSAFLAFF